MDKILCHSCILFFISSMYALYRDNYVLMIVDMIIFVGSFAHHATDQAGSIFHKIDRCTSRFGTLFHVCLPFTDRLPMNLISFFIANNITTSYYLSVYTNQLVPDAYLWKLCHVNFHFVVFVAQMYAIHFYEPPECLITL